MKGPGVGAREAKTGNGSKHQQLITGIRIATPKYGPLAWAYFELNATVKKQMWKKKKNKPLLFPYLSKSRTSRSSQLVLMVKNPPANQEMQETQVLSLG